MTLLRVIFEWSTKLDDRLEGGVTFMNDFTIALQYNARVGVTGLNQYIWFLLYHHVKV